MNKQINKTNLYALWLPFTDFQELCLNITKEGYLESATPSFNTSWSWITFTYNEANITMDSLGFIFIDGINQTNTLDEFFIFLVEVLNKKSRRNITHTFLNKSIGYVDTLTQSRNQRLVEFLKKVTTSFSEIDNALKVEYIDFNLSHNHKNLFSEEKMKFSISNVEDVNYKSFHTILNRNFENLIKKGIFFTHGLNLEKGELYQLSVIKNIYKNIEKFLPKLELKINGNKAKEERQLIEKVVEKIIQDTIEERIILNFLHETKVHYLSKIINEIAINNDTLRKLNSYLLEDIKRNKKDNTKRMKDLDDESATEIFIQNLLQVTPKFHMMDTKIQEAYYIKIGNTTTNLSIRKEETILDTFYYRKWKSSINFCIDTANKAKESLTIYHQNKTLRELEDISYNANYQADIEDIRELKKSKAFALDESSKKILFFIAIVTLAGEAPLLEFGKYPSINELSDIIKVFAKMGLNFIEILVNFSIYFILVKVLRNLFKTKENKHKKKFLPSLLNILKQPFSHKEKLLLHTFEDSDYDKHEHRSNRSLYRYNKEIKKYEKIPISYNNLVSSYTLVDKVKQIKLLQKTALKVFSFHMFPELLRDVPIGSDKNHIYRENYRISGNDRVATKIMYRYKINELTLKEFLNYLKKDDFMRKYEEYLEHETKESFLISKAIKNLEPHKYVKEDIKLTLYIVYSFVLKFDHTDENDENIYHYTISKDQFRVHYHINKLDYTNKTDFENKQAELAKLVDIYFLKRLKRFKEVELN
jgi:hypothetical protein